ncbi:uncharacterized protein LOC120676326 isoform X2 [Panicum virgatum]|uniref:RING-type E3 ubiquitin transferase n=1 Tax=Panicum virgatum TaxID=38727 RepID=A0A8T0S5L0_PANVG|nr:uncharacterized protein LOC120676326 isoform X2 [Panicum virgatum]KAG2593901.1 hypothetical protein PVAP13_5NG264402 [Panicum virgatum]
MQPAAADDKIYLVMGGSEIHYYISLGWALQNVPLHKTVVLVYIFRPAFDIPMLSRVVQPTDDFLISAYRRGRREHILRSSELHVRICARKKVRAEKLIVENDDVAAALLDLIVQHQVTTLILSSVIDRIYRSEGKILEKLEKQANPSCSIFYLHNGNLISTRRGHVNVYAVGSGTYDLPASSGTSQCLSGSSNNTSDTLSSLFRDSCSTGSGFDVALLDNLSLENTNSMMHDTRFSVVFDHESLSTFKGEQLAI